MGTLDYQRPSLTDPSRHPPLAPWIRRMWMINSLLLVLWPLGLWVVEYAHRHGHTRLVLGWIEVALFGMVAGMLATLILTGASGILWLGSAIDLWLGWARLSRRDWIGFASYGVLVLTYASLIAIAAIAH